jgi:hypothetical protein
MDTTAFQITEALEQLFYFVGDNTNINHEHILTPLVGNTLAVRTCSGTDTCRLLTGIFLSLILRFATFLHIVLFHAMDLLPNLLRFIEFNDSLQIRYAQLLAAHSLHTHRSFKRL